MIFKDKSKLITFLIMSIFLIVLSLLTIKIIKHNKENIIIVKYVNKIESELYLDLYVYDYDNNSDQYIINQYKFTKSNILYEIFYYYNDHLNYNLENIEIDAQNNNNNIIIHLKGNSDININDFKLMKLTYNQLNIKNIQVKFNNQTIIV